MQYKNKIIDCTTVLEKGKVFSNNQKLMCMIAWECRSINDLTFSVVLFVGHLGYFNFFC